MLWARCTTTLSFYVVATLLARLFHNVVKSTFLQRCTTLYLRCVFAGYFVGTKLWNLLPKDVIDLPDIYSFKSRIKKDNRT